MGLAADTLVRHLRSVHHMKCKEHRLIVRGISTLPASEKADQFPCLPNDTSPVTDLPIHRGSKCNRCDKLTRSIKIIKAHVAKCHTIPRTSVEGAFHPVLQIWFNSHRVKYWTVVHLNASFSYMAVTEVSTYGAIQSELLMWEERMIRIEADRLHKPRQQSV
jgi:Orsellinic acid/F9775 biosynthesis cluster protein D